MVEVFIDEIDPGLTKKIKGIYLIQTVDKVYIGKSVNLLSRLKCHSRETFRGEFKRMYIIEAYENISNLDLMIMEDFYICKFKALKYNVANGTDAIPPKLRKFLRGEKKWIKMYKQFDDCNMASSIYKVEICVDPRGFKKVYLNSQQ